MPLEKFAIEKRSIDPHRLLFQTLPHQIVVASCP
jgi:hypothetical protein